MADLLDRYLCERQRRISGVNRDGPLYRKLTITKFPDKLARTKTEIVVTLAQFAEVIDTTERVTEEKLPCFDLARYGDMKSKSGSLYYNANMLMISGIVVPYDRIKIPIDDATERLRRKGIAALLFTPGNDHYSIIIPLSVDFDDEPFKPRHRFANQVNAIMDELRCSHHLPNYGRVTGKDEHFRIVAVDGDYLDRVHGLPDRRERRTRLAESHWRDDHDDDRSKINVIKASEVEPESFDWHWKGRLARGKITIISGDPGEGKSQLALDIAARHTTGAAWPDGGHAPKGNVIILSSEDAPNDTMVPRLMALGADRTKVYFLRSVMENGKRRAFSLQNDLENLSKLIAKIGNVVLVIFDPITSYMGDNLNSHQTTSVRAVLDPVAEWGERIRVCMVGISHPPKAAQSKAINSVTGSLAFVGVARFVFCAVGDSTRRDRHLLLPVKTVGEPPEGLGYQIEGCKVANDRIETSRVVWDDEPVTVTADEVMAMERKAKRGTTALDRAKDWLWRELGFGELPQTEIENRAKGEAISGATLRRAYDELGIISEKEHGKTHGRYFWRRPDDS